jgi:hypothetical protein
VEVVVWFPRSSRRCSNPNGEIKALIRPQARHLRAEEQTMRSLEFLVACGIEFEKSASKLSLAKGSLPGTIDNCFCKYVCG